MNYRLFTSLLLMAVLTCVYLWTADPDVQPADPAPAAAPSTDQGTTPGLGRIKIF